MLIAGRTAETGCIHVQYINVPVGIEGDCKGIQESCRRTANRGDGLNVAVAAGGIDVNAAGASWTTKIARAFRGAFIRHIDLSVVVHGDSQGGTKLGMGSFDDGAGIYETIAAGWIDGDAGNTDWAAGTRVTPPVTFRVGSTRYIEIVVRPDCDCGRKGLSVAVDTDGGDSRNIADTTSRIHCDAG